MGAPLARLQHLLWQGAPLARLQPDLQVEQVPEDRLVSQSKQLGSWHAMTTRTYLHKLHVFLFFCHIKAIIHRNSWQFNAKSHTLATATEKVGLFPLTSASISFQDGITLRADVTASWSACVTVRTTGRTCCITVKTNCTYGITEFISPLFSQHKWMFSLLFKICSKYVKTSDRAHTFTLI